MISPDEAAEHARRCAWPRYAGDPWPEAMVAYARARTELQNAWQAVADAAQTNAHGVAIGHSPRSSAAEVRRLIDAAVQLTQPAHDAHVRVRMVEDRDERTHRRLEAAST